MADERVKRCDAKACVRRGKGVERYKLELPGALFQADLCKEHGTPFREVVAQFPSHFTVRVRSGGGKTTGIQLHTMDEIEALREGRGRQSE